MKRILFTVFLVLSGSVQAAVGNLDHAVIRLEQNATDKDAEVVFEITGGNEGLSALKVVAPDGRVIIDFKAASSKMGFRHINLESPEPSNDGKIQADFPAGEYSFTASSVSGAKLSGKAKLSHKFPDAATILQPRPDDKVPVNGLKVKWNAVKNLVACKISIEQEKTGIKLDAQLPATATIFAVPDGFLLPKSEYKVAVTTISMEGNVTSVETSFETATK